MGSFRTSTGSPHNETRKGTETLALPGRLQYNPEKLNPNLSLLPALLFTCKRMCKTFKGMLHSLPLSFTGNPFHQNKDFLLPSPFLDNQPRDPFTDPLGENS